MRSFRANPANSHYPTRIHPALSSFADECCGMLARLVAYVGALALLAIVGVHLWDELPDGAALEPSAKADWSAASRAYPAFAVSAFDLPDKTGTYEIFRHPEGGRKDVFRWSAQGESRSPSSKSIARVPNSTDPGPRQPKWLIEWSPRAGANWRSPASSTANSAP